MPRNDIAGLLNRALDEAMALLAELEFDAVRGAYRQGELTAVSVMVEPAEETGTCHVRVMCHDPGHLGIDWDGIGLILVERPLGEWFFGSFDGRGRVEFRIPAPAGSAFGFERLNSPVEVEVPRTMFRGDFKPADAQPAPKQVKGKSPDGSLSASARVAGPQQIFKITVEADLAKFPALRNAEVRVVLRSKLNPSEIWLKAKIKLEFEDGSKGYWSGRVNLPSTGNLPADAMLLVFAVEG